MNSFLLSLITAFLFCTQSTFAIGAGIDSKGHPGLERIVVSFPVEKIVSLPTGEGNAADDYAKALLDFRKHKKAYEDLLEQWRKVYYEHKDGPVKYVSAKSLTNIEAIEHLRRGAQKAVCRFHPKYRKIYPTIQPSREYSNYFFPMRSLARIAILEGWILEKQGREKEAISLYKDIFRVGYHLSEERQDFVTLTIGEVIKGYTVAQLIRVYRALGMSAEAESCSKYKDAADQFYKMVKRKFMRLNVLDIFTVKLAPNFALDSIIRTALHDQDGMFRREAIYSLGMVRIFSKDPAQSGKAKNALAQLLKDPDELIVKFSRYYMSLSRKEVEEVFIRSEKATKAIKEIIDATEKFSE